MNAPAMKTFGSSDSTRLDAVTALVEEMEMSMFVRAMRAIATDPGFSMPKAVISHESLLQTDGTVKPRIAEALRLIPTHP